MRILYWDTETTGLDPVENDIIQVAGIFEVDGEIKDEFNIFMQPIKYDNVSPESIEKHGVSIPQMKEFQSSLNGLKALSRKLKQYSNWGDKFEKLATVGANNGFDLDMIIALYDKHEQSRFFWRNVNIHRSFDVMWAARFLNHFKISQDKNCKLETLVNKYGAVNEKAHDALSDVRATREVYKAIAKELMHVEAGVEAGPDIPF